jgi:hypothetical protein
MPEKHNIKNLFPVTSRYIFLVIATNLLSLILLRSKLLPVDDDVFVDVDDLVNDGCVPVGLAVKPYRQSTTKM